MVALSSAAATARSIQGWGWIREPDQIVELEAGDATAQQIVKPRLGDAEAGGGLGRRLARTDDGVGQSDHQARAQAYVGGGLGRIVQGVLDAGEHLLFAHRRRSSIECRR